MFKVYWIFPYDSCFEGILVKVKMSISKCLKNIFVSNLPVKFCKYAQYLGLYLMKIYFIRNNSMHKKKQPVLKMSHHPKSHKCTYIESAS